MAADDSVTERLLEYDFFPHAEERAADEVTTGLVDLGFVGAALRRGKRVWIGLAALGLIVGGALFLHAKPSYQATASIYMYNDPNLDPLSSMQTDSAIASEPAVVTGALKTLGLPGDKLPYTVTIFSDEVLNISLHAPSAAEATREANAVASAYLRAWVPHVRALTKAAINADTPPAQLRQQLTSINNQIGQLNAVSFPSVQQHQQFVQLSAQAGLISSKLQQLQGEQTADQSTGTKMISETRLLSVSEPKLARSGKTTALEFVGGAFFAGLVIGLAIVTVRALVSERLYRRDDVAAALSAPVRMSVLSAGGGKRSGARRGGRRDADLARVAEYLGGSVPADPQGHACLAVVAVDDPGFVAAAVARLASSYARAGKRVVVADLAGGAFAGHLGVTRPGVTPVDIEGGRIVLVRPTAGVLPIGPRGHAAGEMAPGDEVLAVYTASDVFLTLVVLDPSAGADRLTTWAGDAVAVVTAGQSSVARVQAAGEMIRDAGARLASGILLGADKKDESFGLARA